MKLFTFFCLIALAACQYQYASLSIFSDNTCSKKQATASLMVNYCIANQLAGNSESLVSCSNGIAQLVTYGDTSCNKPVGSYNFPIGKCAPVGNNNEFMYLSSCTGGLVNSTDGNKVVVDLYSDTKCSANIVVRSVMEPSCIAAPPTGSGLMYCTNKMPFFHTYSDDNCTISGSVFPMPTTCTSSTLYHC